MNRLSLSILWLLASSLVADAQGITGPPQSPFAEVQAIQQPLVHTFWPPGARIDRFADRVFMGGAVLNNGALAYGAGDWCSALWLKSYNGGQGAGCDILYAQTAILIDDQSPVVTSTLGLPSIALGVSSHTATMKSVGSPRTFEAFMYNDNTSISEGAWDIYMEAHRLSSVQVANTYGIEMDLRNSGGDTGQPTPTSFVPGATIGLSFGCGAGLSATGQSNCSDAMLIGSNPLKWWAGIVFANGGIQSGYGLVSEAIGLPPRYAVQWYTSGTSWATEIFGDAASNLQIETNGGHVYINGQQLYCGSGGTIAC